MNARLVESPLPAARWDTEDVVQALVAANAELVPAAHAARARQVLPSREALEAIVADLCVALFPAHFGTGDLSPDGLRRTVARHLETALSALEEQIWRGLALAGHDGPRGQADEVRAADLTEAFAARLPRIRALLGSDVRAAYEGDPAATSIDEPIFCYPGVAAITHQRIAHELHELRVPLIPRIVTELAHGATGIDIHPGARIGASFFIDHGTGVVIGETSVIGDRVRIYQGVTLGARSFPTDEHGRPIKGRPRHPIVENDVTIYAGATILGRITIGRGSSIGGNVWLVRSVPPGSFISQGPSRDDLFDGGLGI